MNLGEVGNTTYESPLGLSGKHNPLHNESSNANDRASAMYMDIDNPANEQSERVTQESLGAMDSVYNSIDEYSGDQGYAKAKDPPVHPSLHPATLDDITTASANYFVLEKEEDKSDDTIPTEDYFVLEKDENGITSNPDITHEDKGIVNGNKSDSRFILEQQEDQQIPDRLSGDNYFSLEKEMEGNTNEDIPIDGTYSILNKEINSENTDDYSHAREVCSSQDGASREGTVDSEDYDELFQRPSGNLMHDSDDDYDHMNNDDHLTSL
ncbi:uncharacterized protein LOC117331534 [Pecten maximus]|uniref:uncharacterized protein LOC117331534 n=1 Tax=Pecten maximus TaxID=6579 RepID=UPI001458432D|nr:uncharacterized protein LOC117331534 [Pecten maximus]XP_033746169.1 uncharacterized protein LOC117331534 [Pecten maximus]XP_033746170.1 uncharacterized protein LOC117331534 [Pecten maximus]